MRELRNERTLTGIADGTLRGRPLSPLPSSQRGGGTATDGPIRVVIVHEQRLVSDAFRVSLTSEEGLEIVGEAGHGLQPIERMHDLKPDVVLLDIGPAEREGMELIRGITHHCPEAKLLILTAAGDEAVMVMALRAGAKGYVSKDASVAELRKAIRGVHQGEVWVQRKLVARLLAGDAVAEVRGEPAHDQAKGVLTAREQAVLQRLASGGTNKDIAQSLFISEKTVKTHLSSIFRKLHLTRRLQAVLYAIQQGLR